VHSLVSCLCTDCVVCTLGPLTVVGAVVVGSVAVVGAGNVCRLACVYFSDQRRNFTKPGSRVSQRSNMCSVDNLPNMRILCGAFLFRFGGTFPTVFNDHKCKEYK